MRQGIASCKGYVCGLPILRLQVWPRSSVRRWDRGRDDMTETKGTRLNEAAMRHLAIRVGGALEHKLVCAGERPHVAERCTKSTISVERDPSRSCIWVLWWWCA